MLADGSRIQVGYYQWESVEAGADFYDAQGLAPTEADGFRGRPVATGRRCRATR